MTKPPDARTVNPGQAVSYHNEPLAKPRGKATPLSSPRQETPPPPQTDPICASCGKPSVSTIATGAEKAPPRRQWWCGSDACRDALWKARAVAAGDGVASVPPRHAKTLHVETAFHGSLTHWRCVVQCCRENEFWTCDTLVVSDRQPRSCPAPHDGQHWKRLSPGEHDDCRCTDCCSAKFGKVKTWGMGPETERNAALEAWMATPAGSSAIAIEQTFQGDLTGRPSNVAPPITPGLYRLHWRAGGSDLAAVGMRQDGARWFAFAPCSWVTGIVSDEWHLVASLEAIEVL